MSSTVKKRPAKTAKSSATRTKPAAKGVHAKTGIRKPKKGTKYSVSAGELSLILEFAGEKWLVVTCPAIPVLLTQTRTITEAFHMAYDAKRTLENFVSLSCDQR